jgi:hypothetical protein
MIPPGPDPILVARLVIAIIMAAAIMLSGDAK